MRTWSRTAWERSVRTNVLDARPCRGAQTISLGAATGSVGHRCVSALWTQLNFIEPATPDQRFGVRRRQRSLCPQRGRGPRAPLDPPRSQRAAEPAESVGEGSSKAPRDQVRRSAHAPSRPSAEMDEVGPPTRTAAGEAGSCSRWCVLRRDCSSGWTHPRPTQSSSTLPISGGSYLFGGTGGPDEGEPARPHASSGVPCASVDTRPDTPPPDRPD